MSIKMNLNEQISSLKKLYYTEETKKDLLIKKRQELTTRQKNLNQDIDTLEKVMLLFQKTSKYAREQGKAQIENLTTRSLRYIFKKDYSFEINISEKRNLSNADFFVVEENENGLVKTRPEISKGGGIVDIVSLALRMSFLENYRPKIEGPLILDEPAKHVSEDYIFDIGDFLLQFSKQMNRQIIMVTHNQHLASLSNNILKVSQEDGISRIEKVQD